MPKCGTCGIEENFPADPPSELRPYGPDGELICFRCAFKDEESAEQTARNFAVQLHTALALSPIVMLSEGGPEPYIPEMEDK